MSFPKKNVREVTQKFEKMRAENLECRTKNLELIYALSPKVREIDDELSKVGLEIMRAAMGGKDGLNERLLSVKEKNIALQQERAEILESLGYAKDFTDLKYNCPICSDMGYVNGKICSCYKNALVKKGYESSGLAHLIEKQSFENFDLSYYKDKEREYAEKNLIDLMLYAKEFDKNKNSYLLMGATGLGKTHLSTSVAKVLIENGYYVLYETAQNIFTDFDSDRFGRFDDEGEPKSKKYLECDLLIIDDLGTEIPSNANVSYLYNIINTRLNNSLPIIASTNLTSMEIRKIYNDRITSRLFGEFEVKIFSGSDIRKQKKANKI